MLNFTITTEWNGKAIHHEPVHLTLSRDATSRDVRCDITAPFFNNPSPEGSSKEPFMNLWDYEVVELFFLNDKEEYLEVELGPHGHYIVLLFSGYRNRIADSLPLKTETKIKDDTWNGQITIPRSYFPPQVTKFNAYAMHYSSQNRIFESLYPADGALNEPDFHKLQFFRDIDVSIVLPGIMEDNQKSDIWRNIK